MSNKKDLRRPPPSLYSPEPVQPKLCERICQSNLAGRHCALLVAFCVVVLTMGSVATALAKEKEKGKSLDELGRIMLIRDLDREIAVAKVSLPRGKHGLYLNDKGEIDQERTRKEFLKNGTAIQPGIPVEITKIEFKHHTIIFQINNGGKRRKKWYQHIQIGMGGMMEPLDQQQQQNPIAYGSSITLTFPHGKVPDLSPEHAKKLLSTVLDFHRKSPTELYSPNVPEKFKEAIRKHEVLMGMSKDMVLSAKGVPFRKIRETKPNGEETEDWLYGLPPHVLFVVFSGDNVISVHQY